MSGSMTTEESDELLEIELDSITIGLMEKALPSLRTLYDHLQGEMLAASDRHDRASVVLYSWYYGRISGMVADFEMVVPVPE